MSQLYLTSTINAWDSQTARSAFMDANSNVLLAGYITEGTTNTALAIKYNAAGFVWQLTYPGPFSTQFSDMVQLADDTYIATGTYCTSGLAGAESIWLVNIDADGNNLGAIEVGLPGVQSWGTSIVATPDGGFIVTGIQIRGNSTSTLIAKYSANKTIEWQQTQSGFACFSINANTGGTFILSGRNTPNSLNSNPAAILMDGSGKIILNTIFTQFSIYTLQGTDAIETADGNFVMVAQSVIIKFTGTGDVVWSRTTTNGKLSSLAQLSNGNIAMAGATVEFNVTQGYVVVTDSGGDDIIWDNSELMAGSMNYAVFIAPGYDVVWSTGTIYYGEVSMIVFAAYDPAITLTGKSGKSKSYAFAGK